MGIIVSSCVTVDHYKIIQQSAVESLAIKDATEFKVKPIDFSAIRPESLGYSNVEEWKADLAPVPKAFEDSFLDLSEMVKNSSNNAYAPKYNFANIVDKKLIFLKKDEPVTSGIVVNIAVKEIIQRWNYFNQKPDEFICDITFTDAANNHQLFSALINVTSWQEASYARSGNGPMLAVGPGLSFSGRLKATAYNLACVLVTVMAQGKIASFYK